MSPVRPTTDGPLAGSAAPETGPRPDGGRHGAREGRRILVVEDSATQAAALAALLEEHGYEPVVARSGEQALEIVADRRFDLVLSDIVMPGLSGYEVCRRLKTELGFRDLPVVLLTGLSDPMDIVRGLECGADNYITKPYERTHLLARVRQVLDNQEVRRSAQAGDGVEITFLGKQFRITAEKEQILDLLVSSYEELVRTNQVVRQAEQRARFLAEASAVLASSLEAETIVGKLARFAVPSMGDLCIADLVDEHGEVQRAQVAHGPQALAALADALRTRPPSLQAPSLITHVLQQRTPILVPELEPDGLRSLAPGLAELRDAGAIGLRSLLAVPLVARGHTLGALVFLAGTERAPYDADDLSLAQELGRATALAADNARLYTQAQQATRARDDVLAIVSHDLRNPIHAIQMSSSFLLDVLPTDASDRSAVLAREQAAVVRRSARRANALISDLLDVTRIEAGRLTVSTQPVDARELVTEAVYEVTPIAAEKRLRIESAIGDPLPRVLADRGRMAQVLSNLIGNAIKFTPADGTITVRVVHDATRVVRFAVQDTGPGIAADHLPHLFDRYWQARETQQLGTGLGLFIAKGITEAHGGSLWAESEPGRGAVFHFTLPVAE